MEGHSVFLCGTPGTSLLACVVGVIELLQKAVTIVRLRRNQSVGERVFFFVLNARSFCLGA